MNKYYIGYSLPEDVREKIRGLYLHVMGDGQLQDIGQLHITALYIGQRSRDDAEKIFTGLGRRSLPILCALDTYAKFGAHVVITLQPNEALNEIHWELSKLAGQVHDSRAPGNYNPHITIVHGKKAFVRVACPEATFTLKSIALFEKQTGGEYEPCAVTEFR